MSAFLAGVVQRGAGIPSPVTIRPSTTPQDLPLGIPSPAIPESREDIAASSSARRESIPEPLPSTPQSTMMRPAEPAALPPRVSLTDRIDPMPRSDHAGRVTPRDGMAPERTAEMRSRPARIDPIDMAPAAVPRRSERPEPAVVAPTVIVPAPRAGAMPERPGSSKNLEQRLEPGDAGRGPAATPSATRAPAAAETRNIHVKIGKVEIRSTQPAAPGASPRPAPRSGFADFSLTRAYLDRAHR